MAYSSNKSEVARSFHKIALEKGLIKQEPMQNIAQQQTPGQIVLGPAFLYRELPGWLGSIAQDVRDVYEIVKTAGGLTDIMLNWIANRVHSVEDVVKKGVTITTNDIDSATDAVNALKRTLHPNILHNYLPEILNKGVGQDVVWKRIEPMLDRALHNLAVCKNAVTQITLQSHSSLQPSNNLTENILKLCQGLRTQGFDKYASEIEVKFLQYKQADANGLYDVWHHGEPKSGEELLYQAHPDGSHKMVDVDGDAVVEDLLEKQKKIQQVILKTPTGKLAAKDAVNIAKIILAQTPIKLEDIKGHVSTAVSNITKTLDVLIGHASTDLTFDPNVGDLFSHPWTTIKQHKSMLWGLATPVGAIAATIAQFLQRKRTVLVDIKEKLEADKSDFDDLSSPENLNAIKNRADEIKKLIDQMPESDEKTSVLADIQKNGIDVLAQAITDWPHIAYQSQSVSVPATQVPAALPQASPEAQRLAVLLGKVQASTKFKDDAQKGQVQSWLGGINQRLQNPQTAEKAKTELLDAEKSLASYI